MAQEQDVQNAAVFQIPMNFAPAWREGKGGPKALHVPMVFPGGASQKLTFHLFQRAAQQDLEFIQCMYVDNSLNPNSLTFKFDGLEYVVTVPANAQGVFPVIVPMTNPKFSATTTGPLTVDVYLLNIPLPYGTWGGALSVSVGATQVTLANDSGAATGASVAIIAANPARKYLTIGNYSGNGHSMFVNFGAAATATNGIEILPGGSLTMTGAGVSTQSVNLIGTNTETFYAFEG